MESGDGNRQPWEMRAQVVRNVLSRWLTYVHETFDGLLAGAWNHYLRYARDEVLKKEAGQRPHLPPADWFRTVVVKIKDMVRSQLPKNDKRVFVDKVENTAILLTDITAAVAATARALMIEAVRRGFTVRGAGNVTIKAEDEATPVSINDFLPHHAQRNNAPLQTLNVILPIKNVPFPKTTV